MKVLITPDASALIHAEDADPAIIRIVGEAMRFFQQVKYRRHLAVAKLHPYVRPVTYLHKGPLGYCHWVAQGQVVLFRTPENQHQMTEAFFDKQFAESTEFNIL